MCWPPATTVFLRGLEADLWFPPSGHATVGWDGCARGGERQQVGQQQQGRDPQRLASLSVMLHVCDRSATAPVGQAVARPKDLLVPFLLIQRLPSLQSDEFLERAILSYESTNSPYKGHFRFGVASIVVFVVVTLWADNAATIMLGNSMVAPTCWNLKRLHGTFLHL